jgi:hypothetical protein
MSAAVATIFCGFGQWGEGAQAGEAGMHEVKAPAWVGEDRQVLIGY